MRYIPDVTVHGILRLKLATLQPYITVSLSLSLSLSLCLSVSASACVCCVLRRPNVNFASSETRETLYIVHITVVFRRVRVTIVAVENNKYFLF